MSNERLDDGALSGAARPGRTSATIRISLLDWFRLVEDGEDRQVPKGCQRLLALLALNREGLTRREAAALLLPHLSAESARRSLRSTLHRLRSTGLDVVEDDAAMLRLAPGVRVDVWELEELVSGDSRPPLSDSIYGYERLASGLLPGWPDPWLTSPRERVRDLTAVALEAAAWRAAESGDTTRAWLAASYAVHIDPLRDSSVRALIGINLARGNPAQALRAYHRHYRLLNENAGIEPPEATRALVEPMIGHGLWRRLERYWPRSV